MKDTHTILCVAIIFQVSFIKMLKCYIFNSGHFDMVEEHECNRPCSWPPQPKTCRYTFTVEWLQSMSLACYDCPFNLTDCERPGCIPVNGVARPIVVVNRQLPGPHVQVHGFKCIFD